MNTGVVGTIEPDFASLTAAGQEIYDGDPSRAGYGTTQCAGRTWDGDGVCWQRQTGSAHPLIKNNFELKAGKDITVQHNVLDGYGPAHPYNGSQWTMINIKSSTQGDCSAGQEFPVCQRPEVSNFRLLNNVLRNIYAGGITLGGASVDYAPTHDYTMRGNLLLHKRPPNANETNATAAAYYKPLILLESAGDRETNSGRVNRFDGLIIENNTLYTPFVHHNYPITAGGAGGAGFGGERIMSGNVWARGAQGSIGISSNAPYDGGPPVTTKFPGTDSGGIWEKNIVLGAAADGYPSGSVWTGCPSSAACLNSSSIKPDWNSVFENPEEGDFSIRNEQWGKRASTKGTDMGADPAQLPEIRYLSVTPTDHSVLFRWRLTEPIQDIPCVVEVHTAPDFESGVYAGELSVIGSYPREDADDAARNTRTGADRMITIGYATRLNPLTTYYYRLHCGGDTRRGSFTTSEAVDGTTDQTVSREILMDSAKAMEVEYGTMYDRNTGVISDSQRAAVNCDAHSMSSVTFSVPRGTVVYYRWRELDEAGSIVLSSDVSTLVAQ
jgi:hypothetical protein